MTAYAQSEHAARRATTGAADRFLRVSLGSWNPVGCLVSVIDDPGRAADAAQALQASGFRGEHVLHITALDFLATVGEAGRRRGILARAVRTLADWSDNASFAEEYLDEARRGHDIVVVYAPTLEQARLAHAAIRCCGARLVRHYGPWVVRRLGACDPGIPSQERGV